MLNYKMDDKQCKIDGCRIKKCSIVEKMGEGMDNATKNGHDRLPHNTAECRLTVSPGCTPGSEQLLRFSNGSFSSQDAPTGTDGTKSRSK